MSNNFPDYPNVKIETEIVEGDINYPLTIERKKSRVVVYDEQGNRAAIDKRKGKIRIERTGDVEWHRE